MFYSKAKKMAFKMYETAQENYKSLCNQRLNVCKGLYDTRINSLHLIQEITEFVNSIANSPKEFLKEVGEINTNVKKFKSAEEYAREHIDELKKSGIDIGIGIGTGGAVAALAPSAAMWIATTFGTASTGTAISTLTGVVAEKAALAWLGGGALAAGGAGVAGGQALLALAGPVGWGIAAADIVFVLGRKSLKNKKKIKELEESTENIIKACYSTKEIIEKICDLDKRTSKVSTELLSLFIEVSLHRNANYLDLEESEQEKLMILVNNTKSLSKLLSEEVK